MTDATSPQYDDARAKRNVIVLVIAQAILGAQMPINFVMGGRAGQILSSDPCLATLPISLIVLGSMITAPNISRFMGVHGRRAGFVVGSIGGMLGSGISAWAMMIGSFPLLLLGSLLTGVYMSAHGFYRFAAADTASPAFRPKAISWVLAGGLIAAVLGPQLFKVTNDALLPIPFAGAYLAIVGLNLVGMIVFIWLDIPTPPRAERSARGRSTLQLLRTPRILVAMICAMVAYALMNLVMTSTPLAVVGCGFTDNDSADIVMAHVLAMFAPSFFTGHLIARFGVERIVFIGMVILTAAGAVALMGVELMNFYVALVLLGIGWNFGYIGGTAMIAEAHAPEERAKVQGMNDFAVFGLVTIASLASGGLMNCTGGDPVQGWNAVNYAMAPFLALSFGALIWLWMSGRRVGTARSGRTPWPQSGARAIWRRRT